MHELGVTIARRWLISRPEGQFEPASRARRGRPASVRKPCGHRTPSPAPHRRVEKEKRSGAHSPLSLALSRSCSALSHTRRARAGTAPAPRPRCTSIRSIVLTAPPPSSLPPRLAIATVRAKVKRHFTSPSLPWPRSATELRAHRGQPYPPLLLPLSPLDHHRLKSQ